MMMELVVTCLFGTGIFFNPPVGWSIVSVGFAGAPSPCPGGYCFTTTTNPIAITSNSVKIKRDVQAGDIVAFPENCQQPSASLGMPSKKEEKP